MNVLGLSGSLRAASINSALLRAAARLAPPDMTVHVFQGLGDLPLFNPDREPGGLASRGGLRARAWHHQAFTGAGRGAVATGFRLIVPGQDGIEMDDDSSHCSRHGSRAAWMKRRYVTADVFTDRMFGGNPVAVVLDGADLSTGDMQSIALEFNYSETTFVLPPRSATHTANVRIFTPRNEIPFAGHPNIGTAFLLARESAYRAATAAGRFDFEEAAGLVSVRLIAERGEIVGAELQAPERLSLRSRVASERAAACLSLSQAGSGIEAPCSAGHLRGASISGR